MQRNFCSSCSALSHGTVDIGALSTYNFRLQTYLKRLAMSLTLGEQTHITSCKPLTHLLHRKLTAYTEP
jgi:hypothetical protein